MLTTSRKEVFADEQETVKTKSVGFDTKNLGNQSRNIFSQIEDTKNTAARNSYWADEDKEIAFKLFGENVTMEELSAEGADVENYTNPDLMPSSQTMRNHFSVTLPSFKTKYNTNTDNEKATLTRKGKIALVSYVAVVLALVLIISLMAIAVNATMANVSQLQGDIQNTIEEINGMYSQVDANIDAYAAEMGLTAANEANTSYYTPIQTRNSAQYDIPDNWFNRLCEWVSKCFGG